MHIGRDNSSAVTKGAGYSPQSTHQLMHLNLLTLAFSGPTANLEQPFLEDYQRNSLPHLRIVMPLGALFYAVFAVLDNFLMPLHRTIPWLIRFAVVCPALLLGSVFVYRPWFRRLIQPMLCALIVLAGGGIVGMIVAAPPPVSYYYYAGLMLTLIFSYTFIRARFVWATLTGLIVVVLYEIAAIGVADTPLSVLVSNNFFLVSANLAGMSSCYYIEYSCRRDFFLVYLLSREQEKVSLANQLLESKVKERTAELVQTNRRLEEEISERKQAEEARMELQRQLKQAEKMEAIGKLAAGVAHDLNNILTGLVSYPELLLLDLPEESPLREPIAAIQQSGIKAAAVVQDLLSMSRQGVTGKEIINLNPVVTAYLGSPECARLRSDHPHVRLEVELEDDLFNMNGSAVHLSKMLMNLLINAFEANLTEGSVRITTRNCYNDHPREAYERIGEGEYAVLSVTDTGVGIEAADLKNIFEPFFTKKRLGRSGTGLGMTLILSTVKDHGGYIDIQSVEGRGSTFDLYFPATRKSASDIVYPLALEDCLGKESVLVVDDVPEQRKIVSMMLQKLGYTVRTAASGEEAVAYLRSEEVDILVLDMIMEPGIDGCETYRRIIQDHPKQKAIIASGFSQSGRVRLAQELGVGGYIQKPYTLQKIARALRAELDR
jgi:signal transduction histidine kinase